jgi:FkbM family methyltransferase
MADVKHTLRRTVKGLLSEQTRRRIRDCLTEMELQWAFISAIGVIGTTRIYAVERCSTPPKDGVYERYAVRPRGIKQKVWLRAGSSDASTLKQIFVNREYEPIVLDDPRLIIDCGANVGYSAVYFLNRFPRARVVAVEPDPANMSLCGTNLEPYSDRVVLVPGAVWSQTTNLVLQRGSYRDGREWTSQVRTAMPGEQGTIRAFDISGLIELGGGGLVDLLKIDIERSEIELFSRSCETWLSRVKNLCIELHDRECIRLFMNAMEGYDFELSRSGELHLCQNIRRKRSLELPSISSSGN